MRLSMYDRMLYPRSGHIRANAKRTVLSESSSMIPFHLRYHRKKANKNLPHLTHVHSISLYTLTVKWLTTSCHQNLINITHISCIKFQDAKKKWRKWSIEEKWSLPLVVFNSGFSEGGCVSCTYLCQRFHFSENFSHILTMFC